MIGVNRSTNLIFGNNILDAPDGNGEVELDRQSGWVTLNEGRVSVS